MSSFLHNYFHNETNKRIKHVHTNILNDLETLSTENKSDLHKKYINFSEVELPRVHGVLSKLSLRKSFDENSIIGNRITPGILAYVLLCGYGIQCVHDITEKKFQRPVPSVGGLYQLEVYVFIFKKIDQYKTGIYHYSADGHSLEPVEYRDFSEEEVISFVDVGDLKYSSVMVCISGRFERVSDIYGSRGYRYLLMESGGVVQNMLLAAAEQGIDAVSTGEVWEERIETSIGMQSRTERVLSVIFL